MPRPKKIPRGYKLRQWFDHSFSSDDHESDSDVPRRKIQHIDHDGTNHSTSNLPDNEHNIGKKLVLYCRSSHPVLEIFIQIPEQLSNEADDELGNEVLDELVNEAPGELYIGHNTSQEDISDELPPDSYSSNNNTNNMEDTSTTSKTSKIINLQWQFSINL